MYQLTTSTKQIAGKTLGLIGGEDLPILMDFDHVTILQLWVAVWFFPWLD